LSADATVRHLSAPGERYASVETLVLQEDLDLQTNADAYEQAQEARVIHEVEAARLAARRRTQADLDALGAIILESRRELEGGRNLADTDEAFHLALIAAAKNDILLRMAKSLYLMTRSVRHIYFPNRAHALVSIAEHEQLLECVRRRAPDRSAALMRRHYAGSSARWRKVHLL
jgi:DNA-binding FadR family transcriptional regulator